MNGLGFLPRVDRQVLVYLLLLALLLPVWALAAPAPTQGTAQKTGPAPARQMLLTEDADYFGRDLQTLKEVDLEVCKSTCLDTPGCRAFTYNTKARWCFLKDQFKDLRTFPGAVAGRVVEGPAASQADRRAAELGFLPPEALDGAKKLATGLSALAPPESAKDLKGRGAADLATAARAARGTGDGEQAVGLYAAAVRLTPNDQALWLGLAEALTAAKPEDWNRRNQRKAQASAAAVNAYLRAQSEAQRFQSLLSLSRALKEREQWRAAMGALDAALALKADPAVQADLDKLKAEHGFRLLEHRVEAESATPRICIQFSEPLARLRPNLADFVKVPDGSGLAVEVEERQVCVDGVSHGGRYAIQVRKGLPAATGEVLEKTVDLDIRVGNRTPAAHFLGRAYVLPKGGEATIPVVSVNADRLAAKVYRIGDRSIAQTLGDGPFLQTLNGYQAEQIADQTGEQVWSGTIEVPGDVQGQLNRDVTTAIPVGALVPDLKPGVYALTASPARLLTQTQNQSGGCEEDCGESSGTQWFVVSDLGLTALTGNDGLHTLVRSLSTTAPVAGAKLKLIARNNNVLGTAATDAAGYARFEPGLLRGTGGNAPLVVTAEASDGDYGFLDLSRTPFDLTDRGVEGRPAPKPLDLFLVAERGVYRPGETVHLTALVRDSQARAVTGVPLTLVVRRPDGVERERLLVQDQGLGGHQADVALTGAAMRGTWRVLAYSDPKGEPLGQTSFLVEDFLPERLDFSLTAPAKGLDLKTTTILPIDARFLYGAPAAGLEVEGETLVKVADGLAAWPGYRFGLSDDEPETTQRPLDPLTTDAAGRVEVPVLLPDLTPTSRPLVAELAVRVLDAGGRPVERNLTLPVLDGQARLGVRPLFEGEAPEGGTAGFDVIALGKDGARRAAQRVAWTLERVETSFQWYRQDDGGYDYEPIERTKRVASGTLDLEAATPGRIETPVQWGAYRLRLTADGLLPASMGFEAGWYVTPKTADTPDQLKLSLDKPTYRVGDRARVHIEPRQGAGGKDTESGLALVMVVDDRLIAMQALKVGAGGTTLDLPVTADWGPGAYVTAVYYRPMDLNARRMPGRALGLAWAGVDPQDRRLAVDLKVEPGIRPRGTMPVRLAVTNLKPGTEAFVTLAAVDQGILNVTAYKPPEPDQWYFGQRRLGLEFRDLYGQLIDRMQGALGVVRSGGDGGLAKLLAPPPTEELMAWFSGVVRLDAQGQAQFQVPVPDFNGTVRLMAMVWSAAGIGHGLADALVRDPVVVSASLPRFLAPDDRSRLLLGLTLVEDEGVGATPQGAASPAVKPGEVQVAVTSEHGLVQLDPTAAAQRLVLAPGQRTEVKVPLEARTVGDETLLVKLTTPAGQVLTKRLQLGVRSNAPAVWTSTRHELSRGAEALLLTPDLLRDLLPGTGSVLASVSRAGRLDIAGILRRLDRYPHGCTEQIVSRALPLLYLDQVALAAGLSGDPAVKPRLREAITRVLANINGGGRFGLWSPGGDDLWLDAFATDFLTRARENGYEVPQEVLDTALDNLKNTAGYTDPGPADAYALYVLARNGQASIGDLRYLADERLADLDTPMAKAQIGAALALYGDRTRADAALAAAVTDLDEVGRLGGAGGWRADYGSSLRDGAAVLALAAEVGTEAVDLRTLIDRVQDGVANQTYRSTQEDTWLLLAAQSLNKGKDGLRLEVDGKVVEGAWFGRFDEARLAAAPVVVRNLGSKPVDGMVATLGVPRVAPPAGGSGYVIERAYYGLDGRRVELTRVLQGQRLLTVLTVRADTPGAARLLVDDPLPAGLEIDNPNLLRSADVTKVPGLKLLDTPAHQEFRSDRFVAAVDRTADDPTGFQLGYLVRAITPGTYAQPPASVEDMYDPSRRAWTDAGTTTVVGAGK